MKGHSFPELLREEHLKDATSERELKLQKEDHSAKKGQLERGRAKNPGGPWESL